MKSRHVYAVRGRPQLDAAIRAVRACGVGGGQVGGQAPPPTTKPRGPPPLTV